MNIAGLNNVDYWEIRKGVSNRDSVQVINGKTESLSQSSSSGISIRVLIDGSWGFAYSDFENIPELTKKAVKLAKLLGKGDNLIPELNSWNEKFTTNVKINPDDIGYEEIVSKFKKKYSELLASEKKGMVSNKSNTKIKNASFNYHTTNKKIEFENSEGSNLRQNLKYSVISVGISALNSSRSATSGLEHYNVSHGIQGGYEVMNKFNSVTKQAINHAKELSIAKLPKGGRKSIICDPILVDVLIHEAFGHAAEADLVLKNESCIGHMMNKALADEEVSIIDDSTMPGKWGSFFFDEEGIKAQKTNILKKGVLSSFMHSRETAAKMYVEPTGNARAESISSTPVVRMSNTNLQKGSFSDDELFERIKSGLFLGGSAGGQVDTAKGNFQFNSKYGYEIKNGELSHPVKGVSISGNTLEMLRNIVAVGKKIESGMPGFCGKAGQYVPVLGVNPKIVLKNAIVGGK